ncbi:UDP-glucose 4-epimerase GalE [Rhinocladiella mackenziei CBS 650.93]|uniref:UDP-glucose 4-epimerase n=1 Tax=Rhinocladiella mackenziei CBS 650.93 TaxID=1442369 RepID=A0A0D2FSQ6_9EURO|nr:UDP-glucose 4-epimerase GalE [Rhinocladiella mackenziei CBS 650.93]KIX05157.1 UDP-glucose 4-epimerase GalE [Rhinocladiella mackenziei CBS 650.93]
MAIKSETSRTILVTGGAGYIGSFTVLDLLNSGFEVVVVDNLRNASKNVFDRIRRLAGKSSKFYEVDVTDQSALDAVFVENPGIEAVIHFAALKAVAESRIIPLEYYHNNVGGTISLLRCMERHGVHQLIYSSSATVYGDATRFEGMIPIPEECPLDAVQPYGRTKITSERIIADSCEANPHLRAGLLRYFNPVGAHPSGLIGEDPKGIPNNLLPLIAQVAIGKREKLTVFGNDFDTPDGTPIRDYLHVGDLAAGHLSALEKIRQFPPADRCRVWNLGTGQGATVLQVIHAFEAATGLKIPYEIGGRRQGDVLNLTAKVDRAEKELNWKAKKTLEEACKDLWKW